MNIRKERFLQWPRSQKVTWSHSNVCFLKAALKTLQQKTSSSRMLLSSCSFLPKSVNMQQTLHDLPDHNNLGVYLDLGLGTRNTPPRGHSHPQSPAGRHWATRSLSYLDISEEISEMNPVDSGKFVIWLFHGSFTVGCGCSWKKVFKKNTEAASSLNTVNLRTDRCKEPERVSSQPNMLCLQIHNVTSGQQVNCVD